MNNPTNTNTQTPAANTQTLPPPPPAHDAQIITDEQMAAMAGKYFEQRFGKQLKDLTEDDVKNAAKDLAKKDPQKRDESWWTSKLAMFIYGVLSATLLGVGLMAFLHSQQQG